MRKKTLPTLYHLSPFFLILYIFVCNYLFFNPDQVFAQTLLKNSNAASDDAAEYADGAIKGTAPYSYGDVIMLRNLKKSPLVAVFKPVVFSHYWHRLTYTCKICHTDIGFKMKAGADDITMADIMKEKWCGTCHNVKMIISRNNCTNCHSYGIQERERERLKNYFFNLELLELPQSGYGNMVDWVQAVNDRKISPLPDLEDDTLMEILDMDIEFEVKSDNIPLVNVIFPHKEHTQWLSCSNCHPQIFKDKIGENNITMSEINSGKFCGICHGKVAFPILNCLGCHNQERLEAFNRKKVPTASR